MSLQAPSVQWFIQSVGIPVSGLLAAFLLSLAFWKRTQDPAGAPWKPLLAAAAMVFVLSVGMIAQAGPENPEKSWFSLVYMFQPFLKQAAALAAWLAVRAWLPRMPEELRPATHAAVGLFFVSSCAGLLDFCAQRLLAQMGLIELTRVSNKLNALVSLCAYALVATAGLAWWKRGVRS